MSENETGKISEALRQLLRAIDSGDYYNDSAMAAARAALPLAEQLEAEVVSLRAELEQAKSVKNVSDELQRMQTEFFPAIAWLHELFAIALMQRSIIKQKLELVDLRAQVEQLTADKACEMTPERKTVPLTKEQWIERYGGQDLLDREGLEVVPCYSCEDPICHEWRVVRRNG